MRAATPRVVGLIGLALGLVSACTDSTAKNFDPSATGQSTAPQAVCFYEYCNVTTASNYQAASTRLTAARVPRMGCRPMLSALRLPR